MSGLRFKVDMQWFKFDVLGYEKDMRKFMDDYVKESGKVWLQAATESVPLPTWSGATRASFQKLAQALGTSVAIGPRARSNKKDRVALGRSTSGGKIILDTKNNYYGFEWSSNLRYLNYNEFNRAVPGPGPPAPIWTPIKNTPYGFQQKALEAWETYTKGVELPEPLKSKFLKKFRIR